MRPRALLVAVLATLPASSLAAQTINVPAIQGFRPTAVLLPHVRYVVGVDSADGVALISGLSVPPVTFTGSIRFEGVQPGARSPERHAFADTVRFEADGRVVMLVADAAGRPPMTVEVTGSRGAAAGRINVTAQRWPLSRVLLATISPADLYELAYQSTGLGVRDHIRVDERQGFVFLTDSTAGSTTVAIGLGRLTRGRIQSDLTSIVVVRNFGGQTLGEPRTVGAVSMVIDPSRDDGGTARAEIIFGVGNSEAEAARAARLASDEPQSTPRAPALRWHTPSGDADLLVRHLLAAAGWMLDWDRLGGERTIPSSAARPVMRAEDAWAAAPLALQRGDTAAVCGSYRLLRGVGPGATHVEIGPRLGNRGRYLGASDSTSASADAALVLLAHACYAATRDAALLRGDLPALAAAAACAARAESGDLGAEAVERLAEMDDEMGRMAGSEWPGHGDSLRAEAARLAGRGSTPLPGALWRSVFSESQRGISREYGRLSAGGDVGGTSLAAGGTLVGLMGGEIFGVSEYLDRLEIAPQLGGIADEQTWQLDGWLLGGGDTLGMTYRPASRSVVIRLTASQRHRVVLRFPWLTAASCAQARRGSDTDRLALVAQADGSFYVDVRGAFDRAEIYLAAACP